MRDVYSMFVKADIEDLLYSGLYSIVYFIMTEKDVMINKIVSMLTDDDDVTNDEIILALKDINTMMEVYDVPDINGSIDHVRDYLLGNIPADDLEVISIIISKYEKIWDISHSYYYGDEITPIESRKFGDNEFYWMLVLWEKPVKKIAQIQTNTMEKYIDDNIHIWYKLLDDMMYVSNVNTSNGINVDDLISATAELNNDLDILKDADKYVVEYIEDIIRKCNALYDAFYDM